MSFAETLKDLLVRIRGAELLMICGIDGMPVEHVGSATITEPEDLNAETSQLMRNIADACESLSLGTASEATFKTEKCTVVLSAITPEYYFAAVLRPSGNSGQARFLLKSTAASIAHEF